MLVCVSLPNLARETAGAARTRSSLRPLISMRANEFVKPGRNAPPECEACLYLPSFRGDAKASNPESRDSPMCNCTSEVWSFGPSGNDASGESAPHSQSSSPGLTGRSSIPGRLSRAENSPVHDRLLDHAVDALGAIHGLGDPQVGGQAAEHVGVLARQIALLAQQHDHVAQRPHHA